MWIYGRYFFVLDKNFMRFIMCTLKKFLAVFVSAGLVCASIPLGVFAAEANKLEIEPLNPEFVE